MSFLKKWGSSSTPNNNGANGTSSTGQANNNNNINGGGGGGGGGMGGGNGTGMGGGTNPSMATGSMGATGLNDGNTGNPSSSVFDGSIYDPTKKAWYNEQPSERYYGLENFGNTCYANSVLQSLYFSKPFRELVEAYSKPGSAPATTPSISSSASHESSTLSPQLGGGAKPNLPPLNTTISAGGASAAGKRPSTASSVGRSMFGVTKRQASVEVPPPAPPQTNINSPGMVGGAPLAHSTTASTTASFTGVGIPVLSGTGSLMNSASVASSVSAADSTLLTTLHDLFLSISTQQSSTGTLAPLAFINQLKKDNEFFRSTLHQDAHEFLNYLINMIADALEKDDNTRKAKGLPRMFSTDKDGVKTWVHRLFEGVLTNETRCLCCETVTSRDEAFLDLSIDIEQNSSLTACLRQFSASEMLCQRNKFSCEKCCGLQEAEKRCDSYCVSGTKNSQQADREPFRCIRRMKIKKLPNILALHLKRFKYEETLQRHVKLNYRVVFPFELRLFNTADGVNNPDRLYELWAIVVHIGVGPHHGHYITIVRSGARWIVFDDNNVYPIDQADISKFFGDTPGQGSGYVLFYQACDLDVRGLGLQQEAAPAEAGAYGGVWVEPVGPGANGIKEGTRQRQQSHASTTYSILTSASNTTSSSSANGGLGLRLDERDRATATASVAPASPCSSGPPAQSEFVLDPISPGPPPTTTAAQANAHMPPSPFAASTASFPNILAAPSPPLQPNTGGGWGLMSRKSVSNKLGRSLSLAPSSKDDSTNRTQPSPQVTQHHLPPSAVPSLINGQGLSMDTNSITTLPSTAEDDHLISRVNGVHLDDGRVDPTPASSALSASTSSYSKEDKPLPRTSAELSAPSNSVSSSLGDSVLKSTRSFLGRSTTANNLNSSASGPMTNGRSPIGGAMLSSSITTPNLSGSAFEGSASGNLNERNGSLSSGTSGSGTPILGGSTLGAFTTPSVGAPMDHTLSALGSSTHGLSKKEMDRLEKRQRELMKAQHKLEKKKEEERKKRDKEMEKEARKEDKLRKKMGSRG
ncbi:BQ2448_2835 [Microbotryum intermedium]|uniref:ubiquitinyl hydrolase 1 n=1 Tax=Microbotryum intermedium TaxID=269621 RepID=A0A238FDI3_9BASI|nr:BQ2448_2835 [Microbotryum intermedium]